MVDNYFIRASPHEMHFCDNLIIGLYVKRAFFFIIFELDFHSKCSWAIFLKEWKCTQIREKPPLAAKETKIRVLTDAAHWIPQF